MRLKITTIFIGLLFSNSSFAENTSGFFVKTGIGAALISPNQSPAPDNWVTDPSFNWSLKGGYRVNQYFGIEGGFQDFGEINGERILDYHPVLESKKIIGSAWMIGAIGNYEVLPNIELNAHAGWYTWHYKAEEKEVSLSPSYTYSYNSKGVINGNDPYVGAGVAWAINQNISLGIDWTSFILTKPGNSNDSLGSINTFEITGQYRF